LVIGAVVVLLWNGTPRMLDPTDMTWLTGDDPFAHVMGWEQFRASPLLQYPIAKNEGYGLERSSTVVYSDSIPAAALLLRPLSPILPHPFQYLGWWVVISLVLQGYWGARLVQLRSDRLSHAVLGAGFFMVAPVLLNRIGLHTALTTQWLILCALWLYFSSCEVQSRRWLGLLLLAISVHAYLFVMVAGIWAANLVKCRLARTLGWRHLWQVAVTLVIVAGWMHCLGYFMVSKGAAAGGGVTRFDLLNFIAGREWSWLAELHGNQELNAWDGYAYLGLGLLGLCAASVVVVIVRRARRGPATEAFRPAPPIVSWIPLTVVVCGFALYAASNKVLLNGREILSYPWPAVMGPIVATFRGAGRMIWPTYYVLVLAVLWLAIRSWRPRALTWIFTGCLAVQVVDFLGGARLMRAGVSGPELLKPLNDPIWTTIAARYHKLVSIPAFHGQPDRHTLGWFAARNGIGTNIGYFSRMNPPVQQRGAQRALDEMLGGAYDPDTAYYFPHLEIWNIAKLTASARDLAVIADGHHLLLPGGDPARTEKPPADVTMPPLGTWLSFGIDGVGGGYLLDGWSWREGWGTWSDAKTASFILPVPHGYRGKLQVSIRWLGHTAPNGEQKVHILFEQTEFQVWFRADAVQQEDNFEVVPTHDWIPVRVRIRKPIVASDGRALGLGLIAIRLSEPESR
jgi:hypothetical protein